MESRSNISAIMKFLVLAACVCQSLAAPQGFFGLQGHPNGAITPIDEPRVAALKADHLATKYGHGVAPVAHAAHVGHAAVAAVPAVHHEAVHHVAAPVHHAYAGPLHIPQLVAHPNGAVTPADEPAVVAARANHLAAHGAYHHAAPAHAAAVHHAAPVHHAGHLVAHPNGAVVPADEPAVVAARADHFAAKAAYGH